jgi:hypothetical protein
MIYVLAAIFILALIRGGEKALLYGAFAAFMAVSNHFAEYISDTNFAAYYLLDAVLLAALSQVFVYNKKHAVYHFILVLGVIINAAGYVMWYNFIPPTLYNLSFLGLYSVIIILLLSRCSYDRGNNAALHFFDGVCNYLDKNHRGRVAKNEGAKS